MKVYEILTETKEPNAKEPNAVTNIDDLLHEWEQLDVFGIDRMKALKAKGGTKVKTYFHDSYTEYEVVDENNNYIGLMELDDV